MIKLGDVISHYKILEKLGSGGMGVVYKAQDLKLERFVALKFLPPHLSEDADAKLRFLQEARAASKLDHPNLGVVYEIDETQWFIAMAFYEGETLKKQVNNNQLSVNGVVEITVQIANGLSCAHKNGIIHRDIKPANVMLTKDGTVKIVDFGLAKLIKPVDHLAAPLTKSGTMVGTLPYMSPEQVRGQEVDQRTDLWSFGAVLYELLTKQLPFQGASELALMQAIVYAPLKPLQTYLAEVAPALEGIIERALAKAPHDRYPSAEAMLIDLHNLDKGHPNDKPNTTQFVVSPPESSRLVLSEESHAGNRELSASVIARLRQLTGETLVAGKPPDAEPGSNPYMNRLAIQNPQDFYGRTSELTRIYERVKAVRPQSISMVGVRRIGKSSLLRAIHHPANRRQYLPNPQEYIFVLMDLQARRNVGLTEFFQYLYQELQKEYRGHLQVNFAPDYDGMQKVVQTFQEAGVKMIFLWDEFESVTRNQKFGPEFYAFFRALANNFNVAYLTSSADQLQSLCHAKEISDSPFFNIFTNLRLGVLKPEEARQLIVEPSAKAQRPLALHADFVLEIAGCFPFFIQMACSALFSLPAAGRVDFKKAKEIFLEEARPHFKEYWEKFSESEQAVVAALARDRRLPREHAFALKDLAQAGFVQDEKLFSALFAEFVRELAGTKPPWWQVW